MTKIAYVYKITNPEGKVYVGSTMKLEQRKQQYRLANKTMSGQTKMYASLIKYGWNAHTFEIVWSGEESLRFRKEKEFGELYNVLVEGLNSTIPFTPLPKEMKDKMTKNSQRHKPSEETKLKGVLACQRAICQYDLSGNFIAEYPSTNEAARVLGIGRTNIKNNLTGQTKKGKGFVWKFKEGVSFGKPHKRVVQMDLDGNELKTFESMCEAGRSLRMDGSSIKYVLKEGGITAGGYKWKYA